MADTSFDCFLNADLITDENVFDNDLFSYPSVTNSSALTDSSSSSADGKAVNDFDRFLDSFNLDGVDSCLGPTRQPEYHSISLSFLDTSELGATEKPFVCGFRRCRFDTLSWAVIVDHMETTHSLATVSQSDCWCRTCGSVFGRKQVRDRHRISQHRRNSFFCPDCLDRSLFIRRDNYTRHRRLRHGERHGNVSPCFTKSPEGYRGPRSCRNNP
jgi:hypothetical protein